MGMECVRYRRRRYSGGRRFRRSRRAVVSVVGTLLALLVFFALFGIFLTQYVPLWMTENESSFTSQTQASMALLKTNIDTQVAFSNPPVYATPFAMTSGSIPLIAQPTPGVLNFIPRSPSVFASVTMSVGPGGQKNFVQNYSLGTLEMQLPNRYYNPQTFSFEDDGVVESQGDTAQTLEFPPLFTLNTSGTYTAVTMALLLLYGNATQVVSSGTVEVYSHFNYEQTFASNGNGAPFNATYTIGTHYPCAWATFLNQTLTHSGLSPSHYSLDTKTCVASNGQPYVIHLKFTNITTFTLILGTVTIVTGVGVE
jgi:hypothetical protein